jgi:hypothetical protein
MPEKGPLLCVQKNLKSQFQPVRDRLDFEIVACKDPAAFIRIALQPLKHCSPEEPLSTAAVKTLARRHELHPAILAGRIQYARKDYKIYRNLLGSEEVRKCFEETT